MGSNAGFIGFPFGHMGFSENWYLGYYIRVPYFRKLPSLLRSYEEQVEGYYFTVAT